jgi:hypothetical protein
MDLHSVLAGSATYPPPRGLPVGVTDTFHLVEASDGVADMAGIVYRLLTLPGEGETLGGQAVLLTGAKPWRLFGNSGSTSAGTLHRASPPDVAPRSSLLPLG